MQTAMTLYMVPGELVEVTVPVFFLFCMHYELMNY